MCRVLGARHRPQEGPAAWSLSNASKTGDGGAFANAYTGLEPEVRRGSIEAPRYGTRLDPDRP